MKKKLTIVLVFLLCLLLALSSCMGTTPTSLITNSATSVSSQLVSLPNQPVSNSQQIEIDEQAFKEYMEVLPNYFFTPAKTTADLKPDYYMAFFLLRMAYLESEKGNLPKLDTTNEGTFIVPDSNLQFVAEKYLGLASFDLTSISEWPFTKENLYSTESSEPGYGNELISMQIENDIILAKTSVIISLDETNTPEENRVELIYRFKQLLDANQNPYFLLLSITNTV